MFARVCVCVSRVCEVQRKAQLVCEALSVRWDLNAHIIAYLFVFVSCKTAKNVCVFICVMHISINSDSIVCVCVCVCVCVQCQPYYQQQEGKGIVFCFDNK